MVHSWDWGAAQARCKCKSSTAALSSGATPPNLWQTAHQRQTRAARGALPPPRAPIRGGVRVDCAHQKRPPRCSVHCSIKALSSGSAMLCMPRAARTSPQPSSSATPLSEQHSSAGLDAAAQRRKKGRKCLFRRFPGKPGRPGGKRLLGRRTSISGPATTERGSLRAHLAELVAGPSIAALYPPRVGLPCAILPRPRERQAAG